jgi:hypothetical protein
MISTALKIAANHNINKSIDLDNWKQVFSDAELKNKF